MEGPLLHPCPHQGGLTGTCERNDVWRGRMIGADRMAEMECWLDRLSQSFHTSTLSYLFSTLSPVDVGVV